MKSFIPFRVGFELLDPDSLRMSGGRVIELVDDTPD